MKYLLVVNCDLDNHLQNNGFSPLHSNSKRSIYIKNDDLCKKVNGWHWENNYHGRVKAHWDINTDKELERELRLWE